MGKIKAGFARVCITPPLGTALSGYFSPRYASGVHDELYASAAAFDDGERRAVIVTLDVAGMKNQWWRDDCIQMIAEFCSLPAEAVILNCSHTHTGPIIGPDESSGADSNHAYDEILMQKVRDAAYMALADVRPARLSVAQNQVKDIAFIRLFRMKDGSVKTNPGPCNPEIDHPLGEPNETMTLLKIERDGADDMFLVHFGVHADVIGGDVISADFPGFMRETLENALPGTKVMFLQGAEGDVNHVDVRIAQRRKGFAYSRQMGRTLAAGVLQVCDTAREIEADTVAYGAKTVLVPTNPENDKLDIAREVVALSRAGREAELRQRGIDMRISEALRIVRLENGPENFEFHMTAVSVGGFVFAGLPGEPFVEIGSRIIAESPFEITVPLALTDGGEIYFPTGDIYNAGGYEAKSSPIKKGADNILVHGMGELLRETALQKEVMQFCRRLEIPYCGELLPYYERGAALYAREGASVIDTEALRALNEKYSIFREYFAEVLAAAEKIAADGDLMLYICILSEILSDADMPVQLLPAPDRGCAETDFLPLFAYIRHFPAIIARFEARSLPHEIISDTMHEFEVEMYDHSLLFGRPGMRIYVGWFRYWIRGEILRIGRLNFQMTTLRAPIRVYRRGEDVKILMDDADMHVKGMRFGSAGQADEAGKFHAAITEADGAVTGFAADGYGECMTEPTTLVGYEEALRAGDEVLSVHIPSREPLHVENCEAAYAAAREIFARYYPEFRPRAFICQSWMMEKRLADIMGRETNITRFMDRYTGFPLRSDGHGVYSFLFRIHGSCPADELPEDSSMRRAVKAWLTEGNYFYEKGGVFF